MDLDQLQQKLELVRDLGAQATAVEDQSAGTRNQLREKLTARGPGDEVAVLGLLLLQESENVALLHQRVDQLGEILLQLVIELNE